MTTGDVQAANSMNDFFVTVFSREADDGPALPPASCPVLGAFTVTFNSVRKAISLIKTWCSPGPDEIPNVLLKKGGSNLIIFLVNFFQLLIDRGTSGRASCENLRKC